MSDQITVHQGAIDNFYSIVRTERGRIDECVKRVGAVYNVIGANMTGAVVNATQEFNVQATALSAKLDEVLIELDVQLNRHAANAADLERSRVAQIG